MIGKISDNKRLHDNRGFTLVELIVVIVILAVLAAILIPALLGYIDRAKSSDVVLEARYAYLDCQTALTQFYGQDAKLFNEYYNSKSKTGYTDDDGNYVKCAVITHQTLGVIQRQYNQGGDAKIQSMLEGYKSNSFSKGAYTLAYYILQNMDALGKNSKYTFSEANRASGMTYDEFSKTYEKQLVNKNPTIFHLYFDERGRVVMLEYGADGYLVRFKDGKGEVIENGKCYKSH